MRTMPIVQVVGMLLAFVVEGCAEPRPRGMPALPQRDVRMHPAWGTPIFIGDTGVVAVPFAAERDEAEQPSSFGFGSGSSIGWSASWVGSESTFGYRSGQDLRWNNVAFVDAKTRSSHLLLDDRAMICRFYAPDPKQDLGAYRNHFLLVGIVREDV